MTGYNISGFTVHLTVKETLVRGPRSLVAEPVKVITVKIRCAQGGTRLAVLQGLDL